MVGPHGVACVQVHCCAFPFSISRRPHHPCWDDAMRGNEQVYVVDQHESLQRGEELPLNVTLMNYVSTNPVPAGVLIIDPANSCVISKSGESEKKLCYFPALLVHGRSRGMAAKGISLLCLGS